MLLKTLSVITVLFLISTISQADSKALKVGVILPLTGPMTEFGNAVRNGIKLAQEEHPEWQDQCMFIYDDCQYDNSKAITSFNKLLVTEQPSLFYNWGTVTSAVLAPLAESKKVPLVVWAADPKVGRGSKYVIRFSNSADDYGLPLAKELLSRQKFKIAMVYAETQYLRAMVEGFEKQLAPTQSLVTRIAVNPSDTDFRSIIARLKRDSFDALGIFLISGQVSQFYRELATQKLSPITFGTDFLESTTEINQAGPLVNGAFYPNNTVDAAFRDKYTKRYRNDFQITHAGNGYDFASIACGTLATDQTSEEVIASFVSHEKGIGVQGPYYLHKSRDGDRYFSFPVILKKVEAGKIVDLK